MEGATGLKLMVYCNVFSCIAISSATANGTAVVNKCLGKGAKGVVVVVENGGNGCKLVVITCDRTHPRGSKHMAAATLPFPGSLACNGFPHTLTRSCSGIWDLATAFIYSLDSRPLLFACLRVGLGHVVSDSCCVA